MHHVDRIVKAKILEAKNIYGDKGSKSSLVKETTTFLLLTFRQPIELLDTYITAQLDNLPVKRTPTVCNDANPFFAEDCLFDAIPPDFNSLTVSVWNDAGKEKPIGVATFSRTFLLESSAEEEQWFALRPPDDQVVTGSVKIRIARMTEGPDAHFNIKSILFKYNK